MRRYSWRVQIKLSKTVSVAEKPLDLDPDLPESGNFLGEMGPHRFFVGGYH